MGRRFLKRKNATKTYWVDFCFLFEFLGLFGGVQRQKGKRKRKNSFFKKSLLEEANEWFIFAMQITITLLLKEKKRN